MALEDKDLFNAIFNKHSDQPIDFIMALYEKAKNINLAIERRRSSVNFIDVTGQFVPEITEGQNKIVSTDTTKKKFTKRDLIIKTEESITDDYIRCCLCGKQFKSLTVKHLATHGISVEEYKKLCGYDQSQKLMSNTYAEKMIENALKAQNARSYNKKNPVAEDNNIESSITE